MPRLKSANFAVTELTAGINASVTSLEVADASLFPAEGPFVIIVHDNTPGFAGVKEIMEVGSIDKNTNTFSSILRGRENTSAVAHGAGSRVECAWTAGTHAELEDRGSKGVAGGYASLDNTGNVPANQLGNIEIPDMEAENIEYDNTGSELDAENVQDAIDEVNDDLAAHLADYASFKNNIEAIRYVDEKMELKINGEWVEFKSKDGYPVGNVAGLDIAVGNGEVTIKWQDPDDVTIKDSLNNTITIARWKGTKLVRKTGSYPINEADGTLILDNTTRNKYQTNGYKDTGLSNGTTYYYMLFPYTEENVVTIDSANRISATPQAYDDLTGSPGAKNLISGTMQEGFFGEVSASELITGDALASECGISQGTSQHSTAGWLKFAYKGKILFVAKKPIRHSISWDTINAAKCVYGDSGDKTVTIDGLTYKVTLMKGANDKFNPKQPINGQTGGGNGYNGEVNHGSEWNRLMCQIHEQALNKSWDYPNNIESDIGILKHSLGSGSQGMYNDNDLLTHYNHGNGSYSWCQEMSTSTSYRLGRGDYGVSYSSSYTSSGTNSYNGWRPVLKLVP